MAAAIEVLRWVGLIAFALAGLRAVRWWWQQRTPSHAWAAITFGLLAGVVVSSPLLEAVAAALPTVVEAVLGAVLITALVAFPYPLVRLLDTFDRVPVTVRRTVGLLVLATAVAGPLVPSPDDGEPWTPVFTVFAVVVVGTWAIVLPWVAVRFVREGRGQPTGVRRRLQALAVAVCLLAVALVAVVVTGGGQSTPATELLVQTLAVGAALALVVGVAPPRWLRALWRRPEEEALHHAVLGLLAADRPQAIAEVVVPHLRRVLGARAAALVHRGTTLACDGDLDDALLQRLAERHDGVLDVDAEPHAPSEDPAGLEVRPLGGGAVVVRTDPVTPLFGDEELHVLARVVLLADLALQRTELLAAERAARDELAEANRELEAFVYTASHDLKSPLIAMLGYVDVLVADHAADLPEEARWFLGRLVTNGRYMEALIRDLLELSRIGRVQVAAEPVDLEALVDALADELSARVPGARLERGPLPALWANATRVRQLLANLVDNSAHHPGPDGVHVEVTATATDDGGLELVVRDHGPGVPAPYRERVFGVFERLDGEREGGTGIGLAICRRVTETLGGRIWLADRDDGAHVHVWLPPAVRLRADHPSRDHAEAAATSGRQAVTW